MEQMHASTWLVVHSTVGSCLCVKSAINCATREHKGSTQYTNDQAEMRAVTHPSEHIYTGVEKNCQHAFYDQTLDRG